MGKSVIHIYKLFNEGWFWVLGVMIGEDLQKFSESRVMRTIAIGRVPIRNLLVMCRSLRNEFADPDPQKERTDPDPQKERTDPIPIKRNESAESDS
ncbi:hypothetical protein AVEN_191415-1 [Araneus ventricosus]|uniref:Uncharacterized protein n=1 Tax=Araneus ventricosus TaxID=182803 RepID=A0A4Y2WGP4_ARAVE|nr:hypothetical protein AVEN_191415-1 [Araneus ventricosus]